MDENPTTNEGAGSQVSTTETDVYTNRQNNSTHQPNQYHTPTEDTLPSVDEGDDLDDEVRACLVGLSGYKSDVDHSVSPSSCSFYSSCTLPGSGSQVDSISTSSFYSTGTLRDTDTDTASCCSVDTLRGEKGEDVKGKEEGVQDTTKTACREEIIPQSSVPMNTRQEVPDLPDLSYSRPSYLAGSTVSATTGSTTSLVSEEELSFAGHVNDRIGKLIGYAKMGADRVDVDAALANIMGYEIVMKEREKFTVI